MSWYEEHKENVRKQILKSGESHSERDMICPYCGKEQEDLWDSNLGDPNGEENEFQCGSCERHFFYKMDIVFSTRTAK